MPCPQQVEALFLQMMLKSMRDATAAGRRADSNETSMYQDMFDKQVALSLSKHQDLGIARLFERQLGGKPSPADGPRRRPRRCRGRGRRRRRAAPTPTAAAQASAADSVSAEHAAQFVGQVLPTIRRAAVALGVNPLGLLAQAALETGWGQRMPRTADGSPSLNMFGIKAGEEWSGARAVADTVEFSGGVASQRRTAFRAYGSIEESVSDFANLLSNSPALSRRDCRPAAARKRTSQSIARSGYATDPEYGNKLNQILNSSTLRAALNARRRHCRNAGACR